MEIPSLCPTGSVGRSVGVIHQADRPLIHWSLSTAVPTVTRGTVNVEPLLTSLDRLEIKLDRFGQGRRPTTIDHAIVEMRIKVGLTAGDRAELMAAVSECTAPRLICGYY